MGRQNNDVAFILFIYLFSFFFFLPQPLAPNKRVIVLHILQRNTLKKRA